MGSESILLTAVGKVRTRIRLLLASQGACLGLTAAALIGLLLVLATRMRWWTDAVDYLWAVLLLGAVVGLIAGWTRRITPLVAAQIADDRAHLKERLSTAVELAGRPERTPLQQAQLADAAQAARSLEPARVLPWRVPRQARWLGLATCILLAALFVPDLPVFSSPQEKLDRAAMRIEGERLQQVAKELEKKLDPEKRDDENEEILKQIARNMKQLGKDQERGRISKKQAMLEMNDLQKQLREALDKNPTAGAGKSLEQVASAMQDAARRQKQGGNEEAARSLTSMAENLEKRDFEGARRQLEDMAQKLQSGQMSADEAQAAADTLSQMAEAMEGSGLDKAAQQMKEAAEKLAGAADQNRKLEERLEKAATEAERREIREQMAQKMAEAVKQAASDCQQAGGT
jgi:hypothetical protein